MIQIVSIIGACRHYFAWGINRRMWVLICTIIYSYVTTLLLAMKDKKELRGQGWSIFVSSMYCTDNYVQYGYVHS